MKKVIILSLLLAFIVAGCSLTAQSGGKPIGLEAAKAKAVDFINKNLMQAGSEVTVKEAGEESGLYKIVVNMSSGQEVTSYLTLDGKTFFPQAMNIEEIEKKNAVKEAPAAGAEAKSTADLTKQDKVKVELFVMSYCPYGTQIEKGILPVLDALGDNVDFELKFCDYAMHDKKELDEQLNQYCIQKEDPAKLIPYLYCFLEDGDTQACLAKAGINTARLNSCVKAADEQYQVTAGYNDKSTWKSGRFPVFAVYQEDNTAYGITGSPGLVVNGKKISSGRNSAALLKTICAGYTEEPAACSSELDSTNPSSGFGFSKTGGSASGGCGD